MGGALSIRQRARALFSRSRSSVQPSATPSPSAVEDGRLEDLRQVLNLVSTLTAAEQCQITCQRHEWCNATCTDSQPAVAYTPFLSPGRLITVQPPPSVSFAENALSSPPLNIAALGPFEYDPLPYVGFIRLVKLRPSVFLTDPIAIELVHVRLTRELEYAALSYVWGPPVLDHEIVCNGKRRMITKTLYDALRRHRQHQHSEPYLLWADAICINQADTSELNSQLRVMNFIYMFASVVYVDFGNVEPSWFSGLDLLIKLKTIAETDWLAPIDLRRLSSYGLPPQGHQAWASYFSIWASSWFCRTWIVQEVVLAKDIICRFGRFTFKWDDLVVSFNSLQRFHISNILAATVLDGPTAENWMMGSLNFSRILELRRRFWHATFHSPDRLEPIGVLWLMREFQVSNPKDKIVATMGLLLPPSGTSFYYDYSWSIEKLYHRFAAWLVRDARPLWGSYERNRMLSHSGLERRVAGSPESASLPTWVPDWRAQSIKQYAKPLNTIRKLPYRARSRDAGSVMLLIPGDEAPDTREATEIFMSGSLLDTITGIADGRTGQFEPDDILEWHTNAFDLCEHTAVRGRLLYRDWEDAFSRTILGNDLYSEDHSMDAYTPITDPQTTRRGAIEELSSNSRRAIEAMVSQTHRSRIATYLGQMTACCRRRRFAVGEKGYMGLVPEMAVIGDHVFLISGCTVPFVLRPKLSPGMETRYAIVGECYIHGIMDGEPIEGVDDIRGSPIRVC